MMEILFALVGLSVLWAIIVMVDRPASTSSVAPAPELPKVEPVAVEPLLPLPQEESLPKPPASEFFNKNQAMLAASEGRLERSVLLQVLDNSRRLGLTADEIHVFEIAMKAKAPPAPVVIDPRTIVVSGSLHAWEEHQMWLNSDEYHYDKRESFDER